jgi:phage N-6-adenine-methyltransferase
MEVIRGELVKVDATATMIGEEYRKAKNSQIDAIQRLHAIGLSLSEKKKELGHGNWLPWLEEYENELGFGHPTATRLMKLSNIALAQHLTTEDAVAISRQVWGHTHNHLAQGTGENEWYTPIQYIHAARKVMGDIDLDPATSEIAQSRIGATNYFTNDALVKEWHGRVWLNPPYSKELIGPFIQKLADEFGSGRVHEAIMLTHSYTDTGWFHTAEAGAALICFTRGRIAFESPDGDKAVPTQGQAFFYYGDNAEKFAEVFREYGFVR